MQGVIAIDLGSIDSTRIVSVGTPHISLGLLKIVPEMLRGVCAWLLLGVYTGPREKSCALYTRGLIVYERGFNLKLASNVVYDTA